MLFGSAGVRAPTNFPRTDLVEVFLTGVPGLNQTTATAEMLRLNTSTPAVPAAAQNNLGVIGGDVAGFCCVQVRPSHVQVSPIAVLLLPNPPKRTTLRLAPW